jgi:predicted nucleotidyltransferase
MENAHPKNKRYLNICIKKKSFKRKSYTKKRYEKYKEGVKRREEAQIGFKYH